MPTSPDYQQALDYIFSFVDYSKTHAANLAPENFDLGRMFALLRRLGDPHTTYPTIHIAGTKGKGSTAAFCASVLSAAGYRTGLYTSPHLQDFSERIQVDGSPVAQADLVALVERIKPHVAAVPQISTFEITTALGFWYFAEQAVEAAVIEVGLGGRLDATNVLTPLVCVITAISLDHVPILGTTVPEIAAEKAGIIKPGVPVVIAPQNQEALEVIERTAGAQGSPVLRVGQETGYKLQSQSLEGQQIAVWEAGGTPAALTIPLLGDHQAANAATAWSALQEAARRGLPARDTAIEAGFRQTSWPGRFEILHRQPFVILDAAHNEDSAVKLLATLDAYLPGRRVFLVFGASGDKAAGRMLAALQPRVHRLIATRSLHPRAMDPQAIVQAAAVHGIDGEPIETVEAALESALRQADRDDVILVTGSVFVAGAAREIARALL